MRCPIYYNKKYDNCMGRSKFIECLRDVRIMKKKKKIKNKGYRTLTQKHYIYISSFNKVGQILTHWG